MDVQCPGKKKCCSNQRGYTPENLYTGKVMQLSTALGYAVILYQDKLVYSEAIRSNYSLRNNRRHSVASI